MTLPDQSFELMDLYHGWSRGKIENGCLIIEEEIYGDDEYPDSEFHCKFTKEETEILLSRMTLDDFIAGYKEGGKRWMEEKAKEYNLNPYEIVI